MAAKIASGIEVIHYSRLTCNESHFFCGEGFQSWIAGFKDFHHVAGGTNLGIDVKFFKKKRMAGIVGRKAQVQCVATVDADYRRIFPIPETPDMNGSANWLFRIKLADECRNQSERNDDEKVYAVFSEFFQG